MGWKGHGGKFILDTVGPRLGVWTVSKWVVQCNEPILAALGSLSNFLFDCTPALSFLLSSLAHSFDLSKLVKAYTPNQSDS